jgi:hypothetical protein
VSPVIGQGIVLSEKWPGIFVVAERGNDFETVPGGTEIDGGGEREHLDASFSEPVLLTRERASARTLARVPLANATHVSPRVYARVHAVCNARNRYLASPPPSPSPH